MSFIEPFDKPCAGCGAYGQRLDGPVPECCGFCDGTIRGSPLDVIRAHLPRGHRAVLVDAADILRREARRLVRIAKVHPRPKRILAASVALRAAAKVVTSLAKKWP